MFPLRIFKTDGRRAVSVALIAMSLPAAAHAYVGPGAGLTAIGTMIALLAALVLAVVGFVWYPMKRLMAKRTDDQQPPSTDKLQ